ncbi:MAG: PhoH family protein [Elusimicrobiales bacterium]|nr:PhoH family protein [Elusimicrobiales bacterium]
MEGKKFRLKNREEILVVLGAQDEGLRELERLHRVQVYVRHHPESESADLTVKGSPAAVEKALRALRETLEDFYTARLAPEEARPREEPPLPEGVLFKTHYGELIRPRTDGQKKYVEAVLSRDLVFGVGPAGTGKTYLAAVCALRALRAGEVKRVILTRPIVEAGEKLGYLPGDISEKVDPYLRPLYDAFHALVGPDRFRALRADQVVEIVPLAYMRGRTLEGAFIILDEAQNTLPEQMKMFLTRMGQHSRVVVTGDVTQIDLKEKRRSGLVLAREILKKVAGVKVVNFTAKDVSRHALVKEILAAYDGWERKHPDA